MEALAYLLLNPLTGKRMPELFFLSYRKLRRQARALRVGSTLFMERSESTSLMEIDGK